MIVPILDLLEMQSSYITQNEMGARDTLIKGAKYKCYTATAFSNSPRSIVPSLLPVRTELLSIKVEGMQTKCSLIGSLGWKSTAVTVPLCPGSYEPRQTNILTEVQMENYLVLYLSTLDLPYTYHSVSTAHCNTLASIILTPCPSQECVLETSRGTLKNAVDPIGRRREGADVVDEGLGGE